MWNSHCCEYQAWFPNQLAAFKSDGHPVYEFLTIRADNADFGSQADDKASSETILSTSTFFGFFCVNFSNRRHIMIYSSTSISCLDKKFINPLFFLRKFALFVKYWSNLVNLHNLLGQEADPLIHSLWHLIFLSSLIFLYFCQVAQPAWTRSL